MLIYDTNYLENGIHLRILRTLNTALEFIMKFRNPNNPKPFLTNSNTFYFLPLEIVEHAYENRKADYLLISKRKGVGVEPAKCTLAKFLEQRKTSVESLHHFSFPEGVFFLFHSLKQSITSVNSILRSGLSSLSWFSIRHLTLAVHVSEEQCLNMI